MRRFLKAWKKYCTIFLTIFVMSCCLICQELEKIRQKEEVLTELSLLEDSKKSLMRKNDELTIQLTQERAEMMLKLQKPGEQQKNAVDQMERKHDMYKQDKIRRKLESDIQELWNFLKSWKHSTQEKSRPTSQVYAKTLGYFRSLLNGTWSLKQVDEKQRRKASAESADLAQRRLRHIQFPTNCKKRRQFVCDINKSCGFACQIHHVMYCLFMAYGYQRTLILTSRNWRYERKGWQTVFLPITNCTEPESSKITTWHSFNKMSPEKRDEVEAVRLPIIEMLDNKPDFLPPAIPEDLAIDIVGFHGDPRVWWAGQFASYLFKPQPRLEMELQHAAENLKHPIVGIHVRRTDKIGTEAALHNLAEYMEHTSAWYRVLEVREKVDSRRVYLATDEPAVIQEAKQKYPNFEFIFNLANSKSAKSERYTPGSLKGIIEDIYMLSLTDFIVCTFSSQVCRLAYELMQARHSDAASYFKVLDDIYYFGGGYQFNVVAVDSYQPNSAQGIEFQRDDVIKMHGNLWNGFADGTNLRTGKRGKFPFYKTLINNLIVKMPTYPEVPRNGL